MFEDKKIHGASKTRDGTVTYSYFLINPFLYNARMWVYQYQLQQTLYYNWTVEYRKSTSHMSPGSKSFREKQKNTVKCLEKIAFFAANEILNNFSRLLYMQCAFCTRPRDVSISMLNQIQYVTKYILLNIRQVLYFYTKRFVQLFADGLIQIVLHNIVYSINKFNNLQLTARYGRSYFPSKMRYTVLLHFHVPTFTIDALIDC